MVDPVSATGVALLGGGAWFASKLFGPSADALGDQLKLFASSRLSGIFKRAEELSAGKVDKPLPPGFAFVFIQKASFSEDTDCLTDMWANLLLSASRGYSSRHLSFADILSGLGEKEILLLDKLLPEAGGRWRVPTLPWNRRSEMRARLAKDFKAVCEREDRTEDELIGVASRQMDALFKADLLWAGEITAVRYPYSDINMKKYGAVSAGRNVNSTYDILVRQRLLEPFSFDLSQSFSSPYVEGFLVTELGVEFIMTCRGTWLSPAAPASDNPP